MVTLDQGSGSVCSQKWMDIFERYLENGVEKTWEWIGCQLEDGREVINSDVQAITQDGTVHCTGEGRCFKGKVVMSLWQTNMTNTKYQEDESDCALEDE